MVNPECAGENSNDSKIALESAEELFNSKEELHPDLKPYLVEHPAALGQVLQHPLVYEVPYFSGTNAFINRRYLQKLKSCEEARIARKWERVIALHERPYRWEALESIAPCLTLQELAHEFAWVWTDSENIWQNQEVIEDLIRKLSQPVLKSELMDESDLEEFQALPHVIQVYRGCTSHNKQGLSWTLNAEKAKWFARRFNRGDNQPLLLTGRISKSDVLFYTNQRSESEVIVLNRKRVKIIEESNVI